MSKDTIEASVRKYIIDAMLFGSDEGLSNDESLLERGIIDSTGLLEIVAFIEEEFGIAVDEADLTRDNLDSVARIASYIQRKQGA